MSDLPLALLLLIGLALVFAFLCGVRDCASIVATVIASRALSGRQALTIAAIAEFIGPFLFGVAVAITIGNDLLNSEKIPKNLHGTTRFFARDSPHRELSR